MEIFTLSRCMQSLIAIGWQGCENEQGQGPSKKNDFREIRKVKNLTVRGGLVTQLGRFFRAGGAARQFQNACNVARRDGFHRRGILLVASGSSGRPLGPKQFVHFGRFFDHSSGSPNGAKHSPPSWLQGPLRAKSGGPLVTVFFDL